MKLIITPQTICILGLTESEKEVVAVAVPPSDANEVRFTTTADIVICTLMKGVAAWCRACAILMGCKLDDVPLLFGVHLGN